MKQFLIYMMCLGLLLGFAACAPAPAEQQTSETPAEATATAEETQTPAVTPEPSVSDEPKYLINMSLDSKAIAANLIETPEKKRLVVNLPPSYYESEKQYPVVYYLHGHGEQVGSYINSNKGSLNEAFAADADEFIFVEIEGGVSYYVNSPVTGNWEDYIITEVIPLIDETYRTLPAAESRGICGFSMGGFGALNLALKHPDVFGAVYAMGPGLLAEDGFAEAMESWQRDGSFLRDYARAFAPDTSAEHLGHIPTMDGSEEDNAIIELWENGFGNLKEKIEAYLALNTPLKGIGLCYGTNDSYSWIPKGTEYFSELLDDNGIEHTLFTFEGSHMPPTHSMTENLLPFFNEYLTY